MTMLDISTLETWLWDAACAIRGPVDAPKFKDYILPQPPDFRRQVIVHELLHLKIPNHGPLFKALLKAYLAGER
mgnify:CR=1 FL=1